MKLKRMPVSVSVFYGVCSGIAYWVGVPTVVVRILAVILVAVSSGAGMFFYIILAATLSKYSEVPADYKKICEDNDE